MDSERWEQVAELYQQASERAPASRAAFLAAACQGDADLCLEVQSLLDQDVTAPGFLEKVAIWTSASGSPAFVGAYRIIGLIGEGGMGVVYEAEQENPRRVVALKVVKPGLAVPEVLRRFEQESHALGRLQHPGIAQIYEAGVARGRPFFAMERIEGRPLLEYAAAHRLTTPQRLDLIVKICEATQHAHDRGIVHRDLKPGNILIDEAGQPKILDFGVARVTDGDAQITRGTDLGKLIGTLSYMSTEQVRADPELDARSDVYALGLIVYELLAGRLPYETGRQVTEAVRVISEQDPYPLGSANREFRGDLETIAAKALEKEKDRRYDSAADLASDLRRHLANQPISARPPSAEYLTRKFVLRHKTLTGAAAAVFLALIAGVLVSAWQASRARRAEQTARAVSEFLENDVLGQAGPTAQVGSRTPADPDLRVRTALDRAAARIPGKFAAQPEMEAAIRETIGRSYYDLSLYREAQQHLERALELRKRLQGERHPDTLNTMQELGIAYYQSADGARAKLLLTELLEIRRRVLGNNHPDTIGTMNELAAALIRMGDWAGSAKLLAEILEDERRMRGDDHADTLAVMNNLSAAYTNLGQYAQAADLLEKATAIKKRVLGPNHPSTLRSLNSLAVNYRNLGRYADAETLLKEVLEARRETEGEEHIDTLASMNSLALLYQAQGRYADAEPLLSRALEIGRRTQPDNPDTSRFMNNLAEVYWKLQKPELAEPIFREALEMRRRTMGANHPTTAALLVSWGEMKLEQKQYAAAEPMLREAAGIYEKSAPNDWRRYYAEAMRGEAIAHLGRGAEAAPLLSSAYEALLQKKNSIPAEKRQILDKIQSWKSQFQ